jgi:hypothetical protein
MAANTAPIFSIAGDVEWGTTVLTTQNTAKDYLHRLIAARQRAGNLKA